MEDLYNPERPRDDGNRSFSSEVAWLKAHPGEWAILSREKNYNRGILIQRGRYALLPKGDFKIKQRIQKNGEVHILACYVGEDSETAEVVW